MPSAVTKSTMFKNFTVSEENEDSDPVNYFVGELNARLNAIELHIKEAWMDALENVAHKVQEDIEHVTPELEKRSERMARKLYSVPENKCIREWLKDKDHDFSEMTKALVPFEQAFRIKVRNGLVKMSEDIGLDIEKY